jgi:hypothetical protein
MTTRSTLSKSALVTVAVLTLGIATPAAAGGSHVTIGPVKIIPKAPVKMRSPIDPPPYKGSDGGVGTGGGGPNTWMCDENGNCGWYRSS